MTSRPISRFGNGRTALRREVTEEIKRYILDSRLRPGDPLPTENELCVTLGASRSSIREAVKTLAALDIVEVRHGHGTYVGRLSLSALVEGLTFRGLLSPSDDFRVLSELVDVRELVECGMAERIIASLRPAHLDRLDALVAEMDQELRAGRDVIATDRLFHAALLEPLPNELLGQLSSACWDVHEIVAPHLSMVSVRDQADTATAHRAMAAALRGGDPDAFRRAVHAHYAPVRRRLAAARAGGVVPAPGPHER